jgi:hypothetical protein
VVRCTASGVSRPSRSTRSSKPRKASGSPPPKATSRRPRAARSRRRSKAESAVHSLGAARSREQNEQVRLQRFVIPKRAARGAARRRPRVSGPSRRTCVPDAGWNHRRAPSSGCSRHASRSWSGECMGRLGGGGGRDVDRPWGLSPLAARGARRPRARPGRGGTARGPASRAGRSGRRRGSANTWVAFGVLQVIPTRSAGRSRSRAWSYSSTCSTTCGGRTKPARYGMVNCTKLLSCRRRKALMNRFSGVTSRTRMAHCGVARRARHAQRSRFAPATDPAAWSGVARSGASGPRVTDRTSRSCSPRSRRTGGRTRP